MALLTRDSGDLKKRKDLKNPQLTHILTNGITDSICWEMEIKEYLGRPYREFVITLQLTQNQLIK